MKISPAALVAIPDGVRSSASRPGPPSPEYPVFRELPAVRVTIPFWSTLKLRAAPARDSRVRIELQSGFGCKDEQADSEAAYGQALLWYITGNDAYAKNAVRIMDAWSGTLKGGHTNNNGQGQASWTGDVFPRAAEIIRFSYKAWGDAQVAQFQNMLRTQFLPSLIHGTCENGNKELTMSEALIDIGVFLDDRTVYDLGVKMWRGRAPAYIYQSRWTQARRAGWMRTRAVGQQGLYARARRGIATGDGA